MADTKISGLTALTGANVAQTTDVIPIVDTSVTTTKKILVSELSLAQNVLGTEQASTSGTAITFTGIPAWATEISISLEGVSTNGTSNYLIQLGDAGGIETSGYIGTGGSFTSSTQTVTGSTAGFLIHVVSASAIVTGTVVLNLKDSANFTWIAHGALSDTDNTSSKTVSGSKSTSAALTQVSVTTVNGSDTFDAGSINIKYK